MTKAVDFSKNVSKRRRVSRARKMSGRTKHKFACSNTDKSRKVTLSLMAMYVIFRRWDAIEWPGLHPPLAAERGLSATRTIHRKRV